MKKKFITSVTAVALAALAVTGPTLADFPKLENNAITASAAANGCCKIIKIADNNYTMTLDGEITRDMINSELKYNGIRRNNITRIVAMPGTVLPENSSNLFYSCSNAVTIDLSVADTSKVKNMYAMFDQCKKLKTIYMDNFNTVNVQNMGEMFKGCVSLTSLNLRSFDTRNVTNMKSMFSECRKLRTIYASSKFTTSNLNNESKLFYDCTSLVGGNGTKFNSKITDKTYARIDKNGQPGYFTA